MKKTELKKIVKECVETILKETNIIGNNNLAETPEMYDAETDAFSAGPADRLDNVGGDMNSKNALQLSHAREAISHFENNLKSGDRNNAIKFLGFAINSLTELKQSLEFGKK
jgi:hypothetical protein